MSGITATSLVDHVLDLERRDRAMSADIHRLTRERTLLQHELRRLRLSLTVEPAEAIRTRAANAR